MLQENDCIASKLLTLERKKELEQNYISNSSALFISKIKEIYSNAVEDETYLDENKENILDDLYNLASKINPAALPYASLTSLIYSDDTGETIEFLLISIKEFYKEKYRSKEQSGELLESDFTSISTLAKMCEHLNLALTQKRSLYTEHKEELIKLKENLEAEENQLKELGDKTEEYKRKYDKMTIDFLSMMGIFSTIIFAVFGGLSQIGAIGSNLPSTPIHKILMYISLSSITLIFIVFISFNAISKLTGMRLRSCNCKDKDNCNHSIYEKHPSLSLSLFFFIDLLLFSFILRLFNSSSWVLQFKKVLTFNGLEAVTLALIIIVFIFINFIFFKETRHNWFKKKYLLQK